MKNKTLNNWTDYRTAAPRYYLHGNRSAPGIILLVTLVLLVVLSVTAYILGTNVASKRHRAQYIIDYQIARYGCDSAVKYALTTLEDINHALISRPKEPDFSDLFSLDQIEYEELQQQWFAENAIDDSERFSDHNIANSVNDVNYIAVDVNDPNSLTIRGPYGPPWPLVTKPTELEIGSATVTIKIEDENAKYPLGWAMLNEKKVRREASAGLETFCEWMSIDDANISELKSQLKDIVKIKSFKLAFKPITKTTKKKVAVKTKSSRRRRRRRRRTAKRYKTVKTTISPVAQLDSQTVDFAKLFHSSLIDTEFLARPTIISENRKESALKYMGIWGSRKVNINTAPRQVLEAAFIFGGDEVEIADEIIQQRRIKPFEDIAKLRQSLFRYSDSIEKCKTYITTTSTFFTIRITAISGAAKASAVIAVIKEGKKTKQIAIISS